MIPLEKSEAVSRGLREAFGTGAFEDISKVIGGHTSSLVFRIAVNGSPYLLKIILRNEDPTRHYACMRAAAEAGLAPRVWYTNAEDQISITDFVRPNEPLPASEALIRLPSVLHRLHALPPFARAPFNTTCTFLLNKDSAAGIGYLQQFLQSSVLPKAESEEFAARHAEILAAYPVAEGEDMVSSHNDLFKPDNILFDGQCVWLVDWEAAFLNDRYADLAVVANLVVRNEAEEDVYLREYFGAAASEYQRARFYLMRQLSHLFYTMAFLTIGSRGMAAAGKSIDWSAPPVPQELSEFSTRMWAGEADLADPEVKVVYGRVHWHQFLRNAEDPRYREALQVCRSSRVSPPLP